jgi:hypothetical protein
LPEVFVSSIKSATHLSFPTDTTCGRYISHLAKQVLSTCTFSRILPQCVSDLKGSCTTTLADFVVNGVSQRFFLTVRIDVDLSFATTDKYDGVAGVTELITASIGGVSLNYLDLKCIDSAPAGKDSLQSCRAVLNSSYGS